MARGRIRMQVQCAVCRLQVQLQMQQVQQARWMRCSPNSCTRDDAASRHARVGGGGRGAAEPQGPGWFPWVTLGSLQTEHGPIFSTFDWPPHQKRQKNLGILSAACLVQLTTGAPTPSSQIWLGEEGKEKSKDMGFPNSPSPPHRQNMICIVFHAPSQPATCAQHVRRGRK